MSRRIDLLGSVRNVLGGLFGVLGYLFRFAWLLLVPKAVRVAKLLAAQSQLAACVDAVNRKKAPKPRFTLSFRLLWIALSKCLPGWRKLAHTMQPATVVGWHRRVARFIWRRKSRPGRWLYPRKMPSSLLHNDLRDPCFSAPPSYDRPHVCRIARSGPKSRVP